MHALEFPSLSATQRPSKGLSAVTHQDQSSYHVLRSIGLVARVAMFVFLARCSRIGGALTYTVHRMADDAEDTASLCRPANTAGIGDRTVLTLVPVGSNPFQATSIGDGILSQSRAKLRAMKIASAQRLSRRSTSDGSRLAEVRPLIPMSGLPLVGAAVLSFPQTDDLSDFGMDGVSNEPIRRRPRSHRWIRVGMLVLLAMGLLGLLFG